MGDFLKILVTTADGFIENRFLEYNEGKFNIQLINFQDIDKIESSVFESVDCVVHLAGKIQDANCTDESVYNKVNVDVTKILADKAKSAGVAQFVYLSSIKVYGECGSQILNELSICNPTDAYGRSKLLAEEYLFSISNDFFKVAILRATMEFGPNSYGNLYRLIVLANKKTPLPFGGIFNKRSLVFVDNLIEYFNKIIEQKSDGIFIAVDPEPISTTKMLSTIQLALFNNKKLFSIPLKIRKIINVLKPDIYNRLFGSLEFDNTYTIKKLNITIPYTTEYGILQTVKWYKSKHI